MDDSITYQKRAAPFQSMVKQFDGGAFSNPTMNGMKSFQNPIVPGSGAGGFDPMELFWWLQNSQQLGQGQPGAPYQPNKYLR